MNGRVVLLDFDGVIYKNTFVHRVIAERSTRFCNKFIKTSNINFADNFHRHLYKTYGHTVLGLQKIGYDVSVDDYNKEVFGDINFYCVDNEWDNRTTVKKLIRSLGMKGVPTFLFSNAPNYWTVPLLRKMDVGINEEHVLQMSTLKPSIDTFNQMETLFPQKSFCFVDDNMINFQNIFERANWNKVLFADVHMKLRDDLYVINDLAQVADVLVPSEELQRSG